MQHIKATQAASSCWCRMGLTFMPKTAYVMIIVKLERLGHVSCMGRGEGSDGGFDKGEVLVGRGQEDGVRIGGVIVLCLYVITVRVQCLYVITAVSM